MLQKIKSDRIYASCRGDKIPLQRQTFSQNLSSTHKAICRCDVSPRHVVATCQSPDLFTRSDLLSQLVAATCRLVCTEVLVWS